jgi:hypothetical protein
MQGLWRWHAVEEARFCRSLWIFTDVTFFPGITRTTSYWSDASLNGALLDDRFVEMLESNRSIRGIIKNMRVTG